MSGVQKNLFFFPSISPYAYNISTIRYKGTDLNN